MKFSKKIISHWATALVFLFVLLGCQKDRVNNNNPNLGNYNFTIQVNMNLPTYSSLQFALNSVKIDEFGVGNRGVIVFNTGSGYVAFDGACPNQPLSSCSTLDIDGPSATCPCDGAVYSLFTGQAPGLQYPLKQYRTEVNGNTIIVSN